MFYFMQYLQKFRNIEENGEMCWILTLSTGLRARAAITNDIYIM